MNNTKTGYTKTGKSLKAVRRYYALLNQNKQKSPDDEKLSKRIAVELKTQQEAIEKRSKREGTALVAEQPTDRSELTTGVIMSPKDTGPVFVIPTPPPLMEGVRSNDPNMKSVKSAKSMKSMRGADEDRNESVCTKLIYFIAGLLLGIILGVLIYYGVNYMKREHTVTTKRPNG